MKDVLETSGFTHIGSLWFRNDDDSIRIRLWKDNEVDFWKWSPSEDYQYLVFRGKVFDKLDLVWVLDRCFK